MNHSFAVDCGPGAASVHVSHFSGISGVTECYIAVSPTGPGDLDTHLDRVQEGYQNGLDAAGLDASTAVFRRFFCSDLPNQRVALEARAFSNPRNRDEPCAVSWICQPPVPPVKVALWAYHVEDRGCGLLKESEDSTLTLRRGALAHHWTTGLTCTNGPSAFDQTRAVFETYERNLRARNLSLLDNVMRTWLFVRDIDVNYAEFVRARRELFAERGLTPDTHFIASTGVEGSHVDAAATITLDAYAISGVLPDQVQYLSVPDHLSPTYIYGVTFERGVSIAYRDRKHVIVSGTASIDADGRIVHPGDVSRQLDRTIENMEALVRSTGATLDDLRALIVYVRDPSDHALAWQRLRARFGDIPMQVVVAPVCRPGWLIEVEGIGIVAASNPDLPPY